MSPYSIEKLIVTIHTALIFTASVAAFAASGDITRKTLWNFEDYRNLPFDVETISTRDDKGYRVSELYFTSEQTPNGPNRIFCAFARPIQPSKPVPALIMIHGGGGHSDTAGALWAAQAYHCAVIHVDWSGESIPGPAHYTKWCSRYTALATMTTNPRENMLYHIVLALHRALDYMAEQPEVNMSKVAAFGGSWGGYLSLLLAGADPRVGCVMSAYGAGGWEKSHSALSGGIEQLPAELKAQWFELYDTIAYAKQTKAAVLMTTSANDFYFWLGGLMEHYKKLPSKKQLVIVPNGDHGTGGPRWTDAAWPWVQQYFEGKDEFPSVTPGSLKRRGNTYSWSSKGTKPIKNAVFSFSLGKLDWPCRYWVEVAAHRHGNTWEAELPNQFVGMAGEAYATVFDAEGLPGSSTTVSCNGLDPSTQPVALWPGENLWDKARGAEAWRTYIHEPLSITALPTGAFTIGPGAGSTHFTAVTNSVILASARAKDYAGLRLTLNAVTDGQLHVRLCRYTRTNREQACIAEVNYKAGKAAFDLPWSFSTPQAGAAPLPAPFDGLVLEGTRAEGSPITVESLELMPKGWGHL